MLLTGHANSQINDPLTGGGSLGNVSGGTFSAQGWKTGSEFDYIQYNIPTASAGVVEFDVTGLFASNVVFPNKNFDKYGTPAEGENVHYQLFGMWDRDDPPGWFGVTQWHNPYKCHIHIYGYVPGDLYKWRHMKLRLNVAAFSGGYEDDPHAFEDPILGPFEWEQSHIYHHRIEWGAGHMRWWMDGVLLRDCDYSSFGAEYAPPQHSIRIGSGYLCAVRCGGYAAPVGITYSNFKFSPSTDTTVPTVIEVEPKSGSTGVPQDTDLLITSSEPISGGTVTATPPFSFSLTSVGNTLWLQKSELLSAETRYTVTVSGASDAAGNVMPTFSTTFTTGPASRIVCKQWSVYEVVIQTAEKPASAYSVSFQGVFTAADGTVLSVPGFWDGERIFKIRMMPTKLGQWTYTTTGGLPELNSAGGFLCLEGAEPGHIRTSGYHFEFQNGELFPWLGDTSWRGFTATIPYNSRWKSVIDLRAAQGYTVIQCIINSYINGLGFWRNEGGTCFDESGQAKNYDKLNPAYFRWIDKRLEYARAHGIYPALVFSWAQEYLNFSTEQYKEFCKYIVARYSAYPVFWVLCGEYDEIVADSNRPTNEFDDIGAYVYSVDPYKHPISLHPTGRSSSIEFAERPWYGFTMQQTPYYSVAVAQDRKAGKPVVNAEPRYFYPADQDQGDNAQSRIGLWQIICAGGFYTSGFFTTYAPDKGGYDLAALPEEQRWVEVLNKVVRVLEPEAEPLPALSSANSVLAVPGKQYLVYSASGGVSSLNLVGQTGELDGLFINPRTGEMVGAGKVQLGSTPVINPPFSGDWAFYLGDATAFSSAQEEHAPAAPARMLFAASLPTRVYYVDPAVRVVWSPGIGGSPIAGYRVFYSLSGGSTSYVDVQDTTAQIQFSANAEIERAVIYVKAFTAGMLFSEASSSVSALVSKTRRLYGDANLDNRVDVFDHILFARAMRTYNPVFDYNGDGRIDVYDHAIFAANFGKRM